MSGNNVLQFWLIYCVFDAHGWQHMEVEFGVLFTIAEVKLIDTNSCVFGTFRTNVLKLLVLILFAVLNSTFAVRHSIYLSKIPRLRELVS